MNFQVKQTLRNGIGSLHKLPVYLLLTIPGKSLHRKNSYRYINHHKNLRLLCSSYKFYYRPCFELIELNNISHHSSKS